MASKRNTTFAMTKDEKVAHRKELGRIRQQRWRDKRKNALSLVPPENLTRCTDHYLEKMVRSNLENKAKARKRAKKKYNTISMNPRLLAERKHKDSWRKRVHRAYHGVFYRWKKRNLMKLLGFFLEPRLWEKSWNQNSTEKQPNLRSINRGELLSFTLTSMIKWWTTLI